TVRRLAIPVAFRAACGFPIVGAIIDRPPKGRKSHTFPLCFYTISPDWCAKTEHLTAGRSMSAPTVQDGSFPKSMEIVTPVTVYFGTSNSNLSH
ncbi:MAG: hypothetical protein ACI4PO_11720, partial [Faecousia sp.]